MSKILLDTDVLIDLLRGREATRAFLEEVTRTAVPCCSVVSVAEVYAGLRTSEERRTGDLLDALVVLPVSRPIAELAGRFKNRTQARRLELADCLIAATAVVEGASVATRTLRDFPMAEVTLIPAGR